MARPQSPTEDVGLLSTFPKSPSAFDDDTRISFSKLDNKYLLETEEGGEYEYDDKLKRWIPALDQSLVDAQNEVYRVEGVDENAPPSQQQKKEKKRKQYTNAEEDQPEQKPKKARVNTAVWIISIPLDATSSEIHQVFSRCGVIAEEIDSGAPRIKMYEDDKGQFKGESLVVYFRPESVDLAVQLLDDTDFRLGVEGPMGKMRVQAADFSYKSQQEAPSEKTKGGGVSRDRKKIIKKTQKLNSKLADWDDDDPSTLHETSSRWDKVVILKHMFTLEELEEDPAAILDIKEDIRDECSKLGEVTNIVLYDKEPAGVASVRFSNAEAAHACIRLNDGRAFDGRRVQAYIADGSERFKKTNEKKVALDDGEEGEDEGRRLDQFGNWLEEDAEA